MLEALEFVELGQTYSLFPSELSGGMRRRVAIARAIITQPEVLLYDSPTGGLDPVTSNTIIELVVKQRDVYKTSSLLVTHRLQDAFTMASHYFDRKLNKMVPAGGRIEPQRPHHVPHSARPQDHLRRDRARTAALPRPLHPRISELETLLALQQLRPSLGPIFELALHALHARAAFG